MQIQKQVHVAVAVIQRSLQSKEIEILIAKRPQHAHQGGLWEFPGGKVESGESVLDALDRELYEELGIRIGRDPQEQPEATPLICVEHDYGDKRVRLDVWKVEHFTGEPHGKEGQPLKWVPISKLHTYSFPEANRPIVSACRLPREIAITPDLANPAQARLALPNMIEKRPPMIILRSPSLMRDVPQEYLKYISTAIDQAQEEGVSVLLHNDIDNIETLGADGVHFSATVAANFATRPVSPQKLLGVSCHNEVEIEHAWGLGADYITLSPVKVTASHPGEPAKGWAWFSNVAPKCKVPVYALGGIARSELDRAISSGAQGIAGISCWQ